MIRALALILALTAPFLFPAPFSILFAAVAAFFIPFSALSVGLLHDMLYLSDGQFPMGIALGVLGTLVALLVRRFVETRIIGG